MNRYDKSILRILLKNGNEVDKDKLIESFPDQKITQAHDALLHLVQLGFVTLKYVNKKCTVVLPRIMEEEALRIVDAKYVSTEAAPNKRELIPKDYVSEPFHVFYGEKEIHNAVSEYWLCRKKKDKDFIGCFIFNVDGTKSTVTLGRIADRNSLLSKYLFEINRLFDGRVFFKHDLKNKLPKALTGNRQPIKAVTEYLCIEGYLERIERTSKFKRTNKPHIIDSLDKEQPKEEKVISPIPFGNANGKPMYFLDETGIYPNLS